MSDPLGIGSFSKHGDVLGDANAGHRVLRIFAAVLIQPDGNEGLLSHYPLNRENLPTARITFVTSDAKMLREMKRTLSAVNLEPGARIEWREYHLSE